MPLFVATQLFNSGKSWAPYQSYPQLEVTVLPWQSIVYLSTTMASRTQDEADNMADRYEKELQTTFEEMDTTSTADNAPLRTRAFGMQWASGATYSRRTVCALLLGITVLLIIMIALSAVIAVGNLNGSKAPSTSSATACTFQTIFILGDDNFTVVSPARLQACYATMPLDNIVRTNAVNVLRSLTAMYQFSDLAVNSGAPYYIQVDLNAELGRMAAVPYASDYGFHSDVQRTWHRLFDAHTQYYPPNEYRVPITMRPFSLGSMVHPTNASQQLVFPIAESVTARGRLSYSTLRQLAGLGGPIDLSSYLGSPLVSINGRSAVAFLAAFSDNLGTYKDASVRFNSVLGFSKDQFGQSDFLDVDATPLSFVFADGRTLTLSPIVFFPADTYTPMGMPPGIRVLLAPTPATGLRDAPARPRLVTPTFPVDPNQRYHKYLDEYALTVLASSRPGDVRVAEDGDGLQFYLVTPVDSIAVARRRDVAAAFLDKALAEVAAPNTPPNGHSARAAVPSVEFVELLPALENDNGVMQCGVLVGSDVNANVTALLRITTFLPEGDHITLGEFLTDCRNLTRHHGADDLIIDVSSNGGGYVFLAQLVLWLMSPRYHNDVDATVFDFDVRIPPGLGAPYLLPVVGNESVPCADDTYIMPATYVAGYDVLARGGRTSTYSAVYNSMGLELEKQTILKAVVALVQDALVEASGHFSKVLVVTDGLCGSACSMMTSSLQADGGAYVFTYGGIVGRRMDASSFGGGTVLNWSEFVSSLPDDLAAELPSSDFVTDALARFTATEFYVHGDTLPGEWVSHPGDYHVPYWPLSTRLDDMLGLYAYAIDVILPPTPNIVPGPANVCAIPSRP